MSAYVTIMDESMVASLVDRAADFFDLHFPGIPRDHLAVLMILHLSKHPVALEYEDLEDSVVFLQLYKRYVAGDITIKKVDCEYKVYVGGA